MGLGFARLRLRHKCKRRRPILGSSSSIRSVKSDYASPMGIREPLRVRVSDELTLDAEEQEENRSTAV
jgi:hypothetical protein